MKNSLLIILATWPALGYGQDSLAVGTPPVDPVTYTTKNAWHLSALYPCLTYERGIGSRVTLVGEYGLGLISAKSVRVYTGGNGNSNPLSGFESIPDFRLNTKVSVGIRRYYDFERRLERGRSIRYNSASYVMAKLGYRFAPFDQGGNVEFRPGLGPFIQGVWGFQRTYRKNLYLNLAAGPQLWFTGISFGIDVGLGYTLPTSN